MAMTGSDAEQPIERYIATHAYDPDPAEARLVGHGTPVWILVGYLEAVGGNIDRVAADYGLPRETMDAVLAYYWQHKEAIDARIKYNAAAFAA